MDLEKQMLLEIDLSFRAPSWGHFGTILERSQVGGRERRWEGAWLSRDGETQWMRGQFGDIEAAW